MDTDLQRDRAFWDRLGETDPLWAILSDPARRGRRWDLETFFRTESARSRSARLTITTDPSLQRAAAASASPAHELSPWDDDLLTPYLQAATETDVAFPMFGVPRDELVAFVTARGAALMLPEADDRGGREWEGFRNFRKVN